MEEERDKGMRCSYTRYLIFITPVLSGSVPTVYLSLSPHHPSQTQEEFCHAFVVLVYTWPSLEAQTTETLPPP